MTVERMLAEMSSYELTYWMAEFQIRASEAEQSRRK